MNSSNNTESMGERVEKYMTSVPGFGKVLWPKIAYMRQMPLKKQKQEQQLRLERFVSISSRPDRLRSGPGTEICLIFRSKGCIWARSDAGGCTMCGYINDKAGDNITDEDLWQQFEAALRMKHEELTTGQTPCIFKIFTSGSFMDPAEFGDELQLRILTKLTEYPAIKEIVVESRPQFITKNRLEQYRKVLTTQYFEVGVGLETANDFLRGTVINKGFTWKDFIRAKDELHELFIQYCNDNNNPSLKPNDFARTLQNQTVIRVQSYRPILDGKRLTAWSGIKKPMERSATRFSPKKRSTGSAEAEGPFCTRPVPSPAGFRKMPFRPICGTNTSSP